MILPIHVYGDPVLREKTTAIDGDSPELQSLIDDMIETMHGAAGIGLAAPQVGRNERIFVVDASPVLDELELADPAIPEQPMVFINPEIIESSDEHDEYEEGCLSIPDIHETVIRPTWIKVRYRDRDLTPREIDVDGILARVIQHEYDHLDGVLFIDHLSSFRRKLLQRRLRDITKGIVEADYPLAD